MDKNIVYGGILIAIVIALIGVFTPAGKLTEQRVMDLVSQFGGTTNYDALDVTDGYSVDGTTVINGSGQLTLGTTLAGIRTGSCTIWAPANTIAATTTQQIVCQSATNGSLTSGLTGVTADSICDLNHASSTNTTVLGLIVSGVSASSTAGSIVAQLGNHTSATFTWTAAASSSAQWNYACFDPA